MARSYNVRLVALTLQCDPKWVDNLLSHHPLPGVYQSRQGVERRVSDEGLVAIEATRMLAFELGLPLAKAVAITSEAMRRRTNIETGVVTTSGIALSFPFASVEARIRARLLEAIEALGRVQRGRPRSHTVEE